MWIYGIAMQKTIKKRMSGDIYMCVYMFWICCTCVVHMYYVYFNRIETAVNTFRLPLSDQYKWAENFFCIQQKIYATSTDEKREFTMSKWLLKSEQNILTGQWWVNICFFLFSFAPVFTVCNDQCWWSGYISVSLSWLSNNFTFSRGMYDMWHLYVP